MFSKSMYGQFMFSFKPKETFCKYFSVCDMEENSHQVKNFFLVARDKYLFLTAISLPEKNEYENESMKI